MKRIWFAGPRGWEATEPIEEIIRKLEALYGIGGMYFLTGGATGVDTLVEKVGNERGIHVVRVRACWPVGRKAGPIRNGFIARELGPDLLIALHYFPLEGTNHIGTRSAIQKAKGRGIKVKTIRVAPAVALPSSVSDSSPEGKTARAHQGVGPRPKKGKRKR